MPDSNVRHDRLARPSPCIGGGGPVFNRAASWRAVPGGRPDAEAVLVLVAGLFADSSCPHVRQGGRILRCPFGNVDFAAEHCHLRRGDKS